MVPPPDDDWNVKSLKEYVERIFSDKDSAVKLAHECLQDKLDRLDKDYAILVDKERNLYSHEAHDTYAHQIRLELDRMRDAINDSGKPNWTLWVSACLLLIGLITAQWALAIKPYDDRLNRLEEANKGVIHTIELDRDAWKNEVGTTNGRLDRLYDLYRDLNIVNQNKQFRQNGQDQAPYNPKR